MFYSFNFAQIVIFLFPPSEVFLHLHPGIFVQYLESQITVSHNGFSFLLTESSRVQYLWNFQPKPANAEFFMSQPKDSFHLLSVNVLYCWCKFFDFHPDVSLSLHLEAPAVCTLLSSSNERSIDCATFLWTGICWDVFFMKYLVSHGFFQLLFS